MKKQYQAVTVEEAVKVIKSGDHVHISSVSIAKSLRTKVVIGKSPLFMSLIILGYIFGIIHKLLYREIPAMRFLAVNQ